MVVSLHSGFETELSAEGGQKPCEIHPDNSIDFIALTKPPGRWLKTNDFGQPATVNLQALTPGAP
jgi:hypothetical protein